MIATREQELSALEKIKKIVADLGEGSYLGAAFDGCFELAECNIANDFCVSMKASKDKAEHDAEVLKIANADLKNKNDELQDNLSFWEAKTFKIDEINRLFDIVNKHCSNLADERDNASTAFLKLVEDPELDPSANYFLQAVQKYRRSKQVYEDADKLRNKVREIMETYYE